LAATLAVLGVVLSTWASIRVKRIGDRAAEELEWLKAGLAEEKELRAERRSRRAVAEATVSRYREPLLCAAFDLQARLYNICRGRFFSGDRSHYHVEHTLYTFGQYFAWREIIRQEVQFLDLGDVPATRDLAERLERITRSIAITAEFLPETLKLFRGEQRAIGELLMIRVGGTEASGKFECIGDAAFVERLKDPTFSNWFGKVRDFLAEAESDTGLDRRRLLLLQNALIDLIDQLDPEFVLYPRHLRRRLELPADVALAE
jgi:hypothetical protein